MDTLTRHDLLKILMRIGLTRNRAIQSVNAFFESITSALRDEKKISIVGIGSWEWKKRLPRLARNPKTGTSVSLGKRKVLIFKPSRLLRQKLNKTR